MHKPDAPSPDNHLAGIESTTPAPAAQNNHGPHGTLPLPGLTSATPVTAPGSGYATPSGDLTLAELAALIQSGIAIIRSRIVSALIAAVIVAIAFGLLISRIRPESTAVTTMLAQNSLDQILRVGAEQRRDSTETENSLRNHLSVMQSHRFTVMLATAFTDAEMAAIQTPYLKEGVAPSRASFEELLTSKISTERERGREFFTIKFSHPNPDVAVMVADRVTAAYLKLVQDEFQKANVDATNLLQLQANTLQGEISKLEDQRRDYRLQEGIISVEDNQGLIVERLKRLDQSLSDIRVQRVRLETQVSEAKTDLSHSPTPFENPILANYGNNVLLRQTLDQLNNQRDVLAQRYGPNHPKMKEVLLQIDATVKTLRNNFDLAFRDLQAQLDIVRTTEKQLQSDFNDSFTASIGIEKKANRYLILGAEIDAKRGTLTELLNKVNRTVVTSQLPADTMRVVDPAYLDKPRLPKSVLLAAVGMIFAFGAFVTVPFVLHAFDARLRGTSDIEKTLGKELVGCVPQLNQVRAEDRPHIVRNNVDLDHVESFTSMASQVEFNSKHKAPRVIVITSTLPGEGKSMMASNLAAAFTKFGRKTLIIDCDFRRPTQHLIHGIAQPNGFLTWAKSGYPAAGLLEINGALGITVLPDGTHLIPSGGDDAQPGQYLVAKATETLFQSLRRSYDAIIIDTPPVGLFQDALILSRYAQESILVAREAKAPVAQIKRVLADLDRGPAPALGVIFNDFSPRSASAVVGYRHEAAKYGYTYTHQKPEKKQVGAPAKK